MKALVIVATLFLTACSTPVPVNCDFPEVPKELLESPKPLEEIPESAPASEVVEIVIKNYGEYHRVTTRLNAWQKWYIDQRQIYAD